MPASHLKGNHVKIHLLMMDHRHGDDFSVGGAKIGAKQSRQSNSKYNLMQYVFFRKRYTQCTMGSGAKPHKIGNFREFLC